MDGLNYESQKISVATLANAGALVAAVVTEIAGNDISNSLNGTSVTSDIVQTLASQRIIKQLELNK